MKNKTSLERTDTLNESQRRFCMSRVKNKNTNLEIFLKKLLRKANIKYRSHPPIPGKPDILLLEYRTVVFIDGCFWHGCKKHFNPPHNNRKFWKNKISKNIKRDLLVTKTLRNDGWIVIRIWQHQLNKLSSENIERFLSKKLNRQS